MDAAQKREMLEVPGMAQKKSQIDPSPMQKECRAAEMHGERRMLLQSSEISRVPGVCDTKELEKAGDKIKDTD
jgi:hypothetical protein